MPTKTEREAKLKKWRRQAPPEESGEAPARAPLPTTGARCEPEAPPPPRPKHRAPPRPDIRAGWCDRVEPVVGPTSAAPAMRTAGWPVTVRD